MRIFDENMKVTEEEMKIFKGSKFGEIWLRKK